jgi:acetyl esterase/lipase
MHASGTSHLIMVRVRALSEQSSGGTLAPESLQHAVRRGVAPVTHRLLRPCRRLTKLTSDPLCMPPDGVEYAARNKAFCQRVLGGSNGEKPLDALAVGAEQERIVKAVADVAMVQDRARNRLHTTSDFHEAYTEVSSEYTWVAASPMTSSNRGTKHARFSLLVVQVSRDRMPSQRCIILTAAVMYALRCMPQGHDR